MKTHIVSTLALVVAVSACSAQDESKPKAPVPEPVIDRAQLAEVSIASVQLMEDCPDPVIALAEDSEAAGDTADSDSEFGYDEPCSQSTVQIAFVGQGDLTSVVGIKAARLLGPKGETLDTIKTRAPTVWKGSAYVPWDQRILPRTDIKTSFKLALANWNAAEDKLGGTSFGPMFMLELDVDIGGVVKTVRSSQFAREEIVSVDT